MRSGAITINRTKQQAVMTTENEQQLNLGLQLTLPRTSVHGVKIFLGSPPGLCSPSGLSLWVGCQVRCPAPLLPHRVGGGRGCTAVRPVQPRRGCAAYALLSQARGSFGILRSTLALASCAVFNIALCFCYSHLHLHKKLAGHVVKCMGS